MALQQRPSARFFARAFPARPIHAIPGPPLAAGSTIKSTTNSSTDKSTIDLPDRTGLSARLQSLVTAEARPVCAGDVGRRLPSCARLHVRVSTSALCHDIQTQLLRTRLTPTIHSSRRIARTIGPSSLCLAAPVVPIWGRAPPVSHPPTLVGVQGARTFGEQEWHCPAIARKAVRLIFSCASTWPTLN
jgi:hypothetical protein